MSKKVQVVLGATAMEITPEPIASNAKELLPKDQIMGVYPIKRNVKPSAPENAAWWIYPYASMTVIEVVLDDGRRFNIELQDITNQATWNLGTLAAQQAAINDINAWL